MYIKNRYVISNILDVPIIIVFITFVHMIQIKLIKLRKVTNLNQID